MPATGTDDASEEAPSDAAEDEDGLPLAVKVMMALIALVVLGVVVVDVLHFAGAL